MKITVNILQVDYNLFFIVNFGTMKIESGEKYKIKVDGDWIEATAKTDQSVKEVFFVDSENNYYLESECEKILKT